MRGSRQQSSTGIAGCAVQEQARLQQWEAEPRLWMLLRWLRSETHLQIAGETGWRALGSADNHQASQEV